mmetsp:Transcript_40559/g.131291  ORF Transcript_40559/g.131291 Transcript_40559/m.131291 type:complete len:229 (+) Transcript_40559:445-1131(+)
MALALPALRRRGARPGVRLGLRRGGRRVRRPAAARHQRGARLVSALGLCKHLPREEDEGERGVAVGAQRAARRLRHPAGPLCPLWAREGSPRRLGPLRRLHAHRLVRRLAARARRAARRRRHQVRRQHRQDLRHRRRNRPHVRCFIGPRRLAAHARLPAGHVPRARIGAPLQPEAEAFAAIARRWRGCGAATGRPPVTSPWGRGATARRSSGSLAGASGERVRRVKRE